MTNKFINQIIFYPLGPSRQSDLNKVVQINQGVALPLHLVPERPYFSTEKFSEADEDENPFP